MGGGGWCLNLEDPGRGGGKFCLGNTYKAGGGLVVTAFQHGRVLTEPLTQHIVIIILLLLTHF